ncbi:hypothetical protein P9173_09075 [Bacillus safensis]|uniref:hypothetical protein n=1 Tax=Bacillus TaxID=1386 RepID=UPI00227F9D1A|nr:hypothetical protein [Bacillus safensis]MCY7542546.1 hypothetical protein [Bacillus safensis]MCY7644852.1 hypothetical protein [Bacillus safensis]MCY7655833.1 hypothetical protein [Bacillus safensis]MEC3710307.1 hypothetical protein [Bacillus safensis]MEC3754005.1 hypothetical protein [Bacillus safensis]
MSLTSKIRKDTVFKEIIATIAPKKNEFKTRSGKNPFSREYELLVPYTLEKPSDSSLIGTAFDYLARFRVAQIIKKKIVLNELVAYNGLRKLQMFTRDESLEKRTYKPLQKTINKYIKRNLSLNNDFCEMALILANLERYSRANIFSGVNESDIFEIKRFDVLSAELHRLMKVFEDRFIDSGIISTESNVVFNPHFGIASLLVDGADADIYVDGTLYDFKVVKEVGYRSPDALQLTGYYLLNQLLKEIEKKYITVESLPYADIEFSKVCLYKARFGEFEHFDFKTIDTQEIHSTISNLAKYFVENPNKTIKYTRMKADPYYYYLDDYEHAIKSISNYQ